MQCIEMLNLSMLKLIKDLTEKSKGLRWGTEYLFLFLLTSLWGPFIIYHGEGGWMILEDHMIFKGTDDSRYIRISQSLDLGGGGLILSCHNQNPLTSNPPPSAVNYNWYQSYI